VEALEDRTLPSAAAFHPNVLTYAPAGQKPAGSSAPPSGALTPALINQAYGINSAIVGDGTGETIAIVDAYNNPTLVSRNSTLPLAQDPAFLASDLHQFDLKYNLPEPAGFFTKVNQSGGTSYPGTDLVGPGGNNWEGEEALDVEWAHAIAPGAKILLVEANNDTDGTSLFTAAGWAGGQSGAQVVSMSWGGPETFNESSFDRQYFTSPAGHGVTFLGASGDNGATGNGGDQTGYPEYSPDVVAVGGTTLHLSGGGYGSESGWNFSGGGISSFEAKPSYQSAVTQSSTRRTNPDVSFDGDPSSGVVEYDSYNGNSTGGPWYQVGGTSLGSPAWAGLIALADGLRTGQGLGSLDGPSQTLPTLYKLSSSAFHDITTGNNGYAAGPGYDLVTGLGTPVASRLVPDLAGLWVSASTPASGATVTTPPTTFTLTFADPITPTSLHAGALTVNGIAATSVSLNAADTVATFIFAASPVTAQGTQTLALAPGSATQLDNPATTSLAYNVSFMFQPVALTVNSTTPAVGATITLPAGSVVLDVNFNQAIDPSPVNVSNLALSQGTVTTASVLAGNQTVAYTISGLSTEGTLTVTLPAGTLKDQTDSTSLAAFTGTYFLDNGTAALPTPLASFAPLGSLVYGTSASSVLLYAGDSDHYTLPADPGQTLTVLVIPSGSSLQPTVQFSDPSGAVLGSAAAAAGGQIAVLQTIATTSSGTYALTIGGQAGSTGNFMIQVYADAAFDLQSVGLGTNNSAATAQSLTGAFVTLQTSLASASRTAVLGNISQSAATHYYSLTLAAGETATFGLKNLSGSGDNISLQDAGGNVLASGTAGGPSLDAVISNFVAPAAGTYYVVVSGSAAATYNLTVVRDAAFDNETNTSLAAAQSLAGVSGVLGAVSLSGPPLNAADWYRLTLSGSQNALLIATQTPLAGTADAINALKPGIQLFDPSGTLLAGGTLQSDGRNESILATGLSAGASYYIEITPAGSAGGEYFLGVTGLQVVTINASPTDQNVFAGQSASFTAAASGSPTPMVQWQVSTDNGSTYTPIPGATSTTYTIPAASLTQNGSLYEAVFANAAGSATTAAARLNVAPPPITLQPTTLAAGTINAPYSLSLTASGGSGAGYTFSETGSLPAGMTLSSTGLIGGTPTTSGSFAFTVTATDSSSASGSQPYTLTIASPFHLVLSGPATATAGTSFIFTVQAEDANNNPANGFSGTVSFSTTDPQGTVPVPATVTGGFAVFLATLYSAVGEPWTISATSGSLSAASGPIAVTPGAAAKLAFVTQPVNTPTGDVLPAVSVQVTDLYGNTITSDNSDVVTVGVGSGSGSLTAASTTTAVVQNGVAAFTNLSLGAVGSYTLSAVVATKFTGPNSAPFSVTPLQVVPGSFVGTASGFSLQFNAPFLINTTTPLLYGHGSGAAAPPPSVIVTTDPGNLGDTAAYVEGSLVPDASTNSITFVATDTAYEANTGSPLLPDGTYTVIVRSSAATDGLPALNSGGGYLDGLGTGAASSGDFRASFTVNAAASGADVVWVPGTADGPGQALSAPGANKIGGGFPIYLSSKTANVTAVQVTLNYDPTLLTLTGVTGAHFTLANTSTPGQAVFRYNGPALAAGPETPIGFILATVPSGTAASPVPYRAVDLLRLTRVSLNGGSTRSVSSNGLHLVAYVGDADGNRLYSSNDAVLITRAALQADTGFVAYPLVDPVIVADTDGAGFIPADAALQVNEAGVGLPTANLPTPPIPSGVVFQAAVHFNISSPAAGQMMTLDASSPSRKGLDPLRNRRIHHISFQRIGFELEPQMNTDKRR
jgi:hypothetical protein